MKGNELDLWRASLTTWNFITVQSNSAESKALTNIAQFLQTSIKWTLGKVPKVSA